MRIIAAGTGPAGGLPVPDCPCAACRAQRRSGVVRRPAELLIGDRSVSAHEPWAGDGVLWLPDVTAALPPLGGPVRLALLGPGPAGDLRRVASLLSRLRRDSTLTDDAQCVLVAATHDSQRDARRRLLLRAWGMTEAVDGQAFELGPAAPAAGAERVLVLGGSRSGKSALAEELVLAHPALTYIATGAVPDPQRDADWAARVRMHRERRPAHWATVETLDVAQALDDAASPVLVDSLGSWLTGVLDRTGAWDDRPGWRLHADDAIAELADAWRSWPGPAVAVTDEAGWGVIPGTASGRLFRDLLGTLNQAVAGQSDRVLVVVAGQVLAAGGDGP